METLKSLSFRTFTIMLFGSLVFGYGSFLELAALVVTCLALSYVLDAFMHWMMS